MLSIASLDGEVLLGTASQWLRRDIVDGTSVPTLEGGITSSMPTNGTLVTAAVGMPSMSLNRLFVGVALTWIAEEVERTGFLISAAWVSRPAWGITA